MSSSKRAAHHRRRHQDLPRAATPSGLAADHLGQLHAQAAAAGTPTLYSGVEQEVRGQGREHVVVVFFAVVDRQRRLRRGGVRHELRGRLDLELTIPFTVAPATRSDIHKRSMGEHAGRGPHSPAPGHISERRLFSVRIRDAWPPSPALPPLRGKGGEPLATRWSTRVEAGRCEAKSLAPKRCETIGPSLRQRLSTLPPRRGKGRGRGPRVANSH
jgi:hypothetical protein